MIGRVSPLDVSNYGLNAPTALQGSNGPAASSSAATGSSLASAVSALQINTAVSQLLQGIGGAAESNKTLQMLIALLILLTLLQGPQPSNANTSALDDLAQGGRGAYLGVSMSSTTITVEQTSLVYASGDAQSAAATGDSTGQGRRLDLAA